MHPLQISDLIYHAVPFCPTSKIRALWFGGLWWQMCCLCWCTPTVHVRQWMTLCYKCMNLIHHDLKKVAVPALCSS